MLTSPCRLKAETAAQFSHGSERVPAWNFQCCRRALQRSGSRGCVRARLLTGTGGWQGGIVVSRSRSRMAELDELPNKPVLRKWTDGGGGGRAEGQAGDERGCGESCCADGLEGRCPLLSRHVTFFRGGPPGIRGTVEDRSPGPLGWPASQEYHITHGIRDIVWRDCWLRVEWDRRNFSLPELTPTVS